MEPLSNVSICDHPRNERLDILKEKWDRLLEVVNAYKMTKENLEKTILEICVAMKAITQSLVSLERNESRLEAESSLVDENQQRAAFLLSTCDFELLSDCAQVVEKEPDCEFRILNQC